MRRAGREHGPQRRRGRGQHGSADSLFARRGGTPAGPRKTGRQLRRRRPDRPPRVLLTGFGPFPGVPVNPSGAIVRRLAAGGALRWLGARVETHLLDTVWSRLDLLTAEIVRMRPDVVVMVGVQGRDNAVRLERAARALATRRIPDHDGRWPPETFAQSWPGHLRSRLDVVGLAKRLRRSGAPVRVSDDAGRYLCNAGLRTALATRVAGRPPAQAIFVHVPPPRPVRGYRPADFDRLVLAAIDTLARLPGSNGIRRLGW